MIQQQSYLDIADNTGAKQAMCIKVLRGSSSKGKFKRKVAGVGDVIICAVKKTLAGGDVKQGSIIRCVVVRTKQPTMRKGHPLLAQLIAETRRDLDLSMSICNLLLGRRLRAQGFAPRTM